MEKDEYGGKTKITEEKMKTDKKVKVNVKDENT